STARVQSSLALSAAPRTISTMALPARSSIWVASASFAPLGSIRRTGVASPGSCSVIFQTHLLMHLLACHEILPPHEPLKQRGQIYHIAERPKGRCATRQNWRLVAPGP